MRELNVNNINNNGIVYLKNDYFYYSNITSDEGKLYRMDLHLDNIEKISDSIEVKYIQFYNDDIYYVSENKIFRYSLTSMNEEIIFIHDDEYEWIFDMVILNDILFFTTNDEESTQYIMDLTTSAINRAYDNAVGFNTYKDKIYYIGNKDFGMYSYDLNNNKILKLIDDNISYPIIKENVLYFLNLENNCFYTLNLDSNTFNKLSNNKELSNFNYKIYDYNLLSDNLIFSTSKGLYRYNLINDKILKINNINSKYINIVNGEIWFQAYEDNNFKLYKTDIKGEKLILIR